MFQTTFNEQRSRKKQPSKMASFFSRRTIRALSEPRKKEDKPSLQTTLQCLLLLEKRKHYNVTLKLYRTKLLKKRHKSLSSALLISRYILGLVQRGRWFFCAACPNRKMYLEIRSANVGAYSRCFIAT